MVDSDILLDDEGIELLPADGSVDVNAGPEETPGIRLTPATASLRLGGGTSDAYNDGKTFGNLSLDSRDGDPRILVSTGDIFPPNQTENAVFITTDDFEENGQIILKRVGDSFGDATVRLSGRNAQLTLGSDVQAGDLLIYEEGLIETLSFRGDDATLRVGGTDTNGNGVPGELHVRNATRDTSSDRNKRGYVTVAAEAGPENSGGGSISVADYMGMPTIDLLGGSGRLTLGNGEASAGGIAGGLSLVDTDDEETISLDGATGTISATSLDVSEGLSVDGGLDLGNGVVLDVDDDGVVTLGNPTDGQVGMRLDPSTGSFSITDANGDPVFEVDTQAMAVNTSKSYKRGTIDGTEPGST